MERKYLLAAKMFSYSYDNYIDHVEVENLRFTKLMPDEAMLVERAEKDNWPDELLTKRVDLEVDRMPQLREDYRSACKVIDQENTSQIFREGVIQSMAFALEKGLENEESVEDLAVQICYRAADLSVLPTDEGKELRHYSKEMRWTPDRDPDNYFIP